MKNLNCAKIKILNLIICVLLCIHLCGGVFSYAADEVKVSITTQNSTLIGGQNGVVVVNVDFGDRIFSKGSIKVRFPEKYFNNISCTGDTGIKTTITVEKDTETYIAVKYSFDIADGLHDTVQLGTVSFVSVNSDVQDVNVSVEVVDVILTDNKGSSDVTVKLSNLDLVINPGVMPTPSQLPDTTVSPESGAPSQSPVPPSNAATATPTESNILPPTSAIEQLEDTSDYTLEDIEDLSAGAIVFWSIVSLVAGIWIGIGLGYLFWRKKKEKQQLKDSNSNVIGHL